jgi:hypothetical protein
MLDYFRVEVATKRQAGVALVFDANADVEASAFYTDVEASGSREEANGRQLLHARES